MTRHHLLSIASIEPSGLALAALAAVFATALKRTPSWEGMGNLDANGATKVSRAHGPIFLVFVAPRGKLRAHPAKWNSVYLHGLSNGQCHL